MQRGGLICTASHTRCIFPLVGILHTLYVYTLCVRYIWYSMYNMYCHWFCTYCHVYICTYTTTYTSTVSMYMHTLDKQYEWCYTAVMALTTYSVHSTEPPNPSMDNPDNGSVPGKWMSFCVCICECMTFV